MNKLLLIGLLCLTQLQGYGQKQAAKQTSKSSPFIIGTTETMTSAVLGENRVLNIYLPEGYDPKAAARYPVIYLLDGSANEDFIHVAGLVQYCSFEWIKWLPKSIVVGIANIDRKRDFTFPSNVPEEQQKYPTTGHSDKFISFLSEELIPYIDAHYKTEQTKTIIGQSLGGLLATEILMKQPQLFNQYIIISPSLWWNEGSILLQPPTPFPQGQSTRRIYIGVGKEGSTPGAQPGNMEVDAHLLAEIMRGAHPEALVDMDYLQDEDHATAMHQALLNAFKWLGSKQP